MEECNQRLVDQLESKADELAAMRVPERVRMAVRLRLEMLIPYMGESFILASGRCCPENRALLLCPAAAYPCS